MILRLPGDLRFVLRQLVKTPVFTLASLLCLSLGTGANIAAFSIANAILRQCRRGCRLL